LPETLLRGHSGTSRTGPCYSSCGTSAARLRHVCGTSAGRREEDQWTHRTLDKAINSFNGAALQLDVTKEVSTTDVAKGVRLLALGFKDLADALKR
jgi:hypothetical protein